MFHTHTSLASINATILRCSADYSDVVIVSQSVLNLYQQAVCHREITMHTLSTSAEFLTLNPILDQSEYYMICSTET